MQSANISQESGVRSQKSGDLRICLLSIVYYLLLLSGCAKQDNMYKESRVLMDTYCTITVVCPSKEKAREAIDAGYAEI
ncbi:MAG: hypothetical protein HZC49_04290, partial [Nitrospirae bacterium]|nr:hypothetical protein [Nitrospirota bacterium]